MSYFKNKKHTYELCDNHHFLFEYPLLHFEESL